MGKKPVKIKRYRRSFTGPGSHMSTIRRVAFWAVVVLVLFGLGWLIAKPGLDAASRLWYSYKNQPSSSSQPSSSEVSSESGQAAISDDSTPDSQPVEQNEEWQDWVFVSLTSVSTPQAAEQTAQQLAQQNVKAAVITLKDETGAVYYDSQLQLAQTAKSASAIDAAAVAKAFTDAGVTPIAGIWAFKDSTAPYSDRSLAVKYQGTDYNWLDNSQELGGKPWLNPNSEGAQDYIAGLVEEVTQLGFSKTLVFGLQFPEGYSLDACSYGTMNGSKAQVLTQFGQRLELIEGAEVWFAFGQATLDGSATAPYGDVSPATFGFENVLVQTQITASSAQQAASSASSAANETDTAGTAGQLLEQLAQQLTENGAKKLGYYLTGASQIEQDEISQQARAAGFTVSLTQQ